MTPTELTRRVTTLACALTAPAMALAAWLAGAPAAVGVLAGAALALVNFRWLAGRAAALAASPAAGGRWLAGSVLRLAAAGGACAVLFRADAVDPLGLVAGLSVLPPAVVVAGLRAARAR